MALTDFEIKRIKQTGKRQKLFDGGGLYLEIPPLSTSSKPKAGISKWWRLKYRFDGKEKTLALGVYPIVTLSDARKKRNDAHKLLVEGIDPSANRKAQKAAKQERTANSFEVVAREWFVKNQGKWVPSHADKVIRRLERDIFPWLGARPIAEVLPKELLVCVQRIEKRGAVETAHRALQNCGQIMRYAVQTGRIDRDPTPDLRGALASVKPQHFAAITDPQKVGELLRAIDAFKGTLTVQCALRFSPLVFVRPKELRTAQWGDINLERAEWKYLVTKTNTEQLVPLSTQAVEILRELHPLTGDSSYVFPGRDPSKPMSDAAINAALKRLGYNTQEELTGHGFRAMARTLLAEELHQKPEVIEHQLAHAVPDTLGRAYNRTKFLKERREMMQLWADYLDKLKHGAEIIPLYA